MNNSKKTRFLSKIKAILSSKKLKKAITALAIATTMLLTPVMTSCANTSNDNPNAQYSQLLQSVLTNDYYNELIAIAEANKYANNFGRKYAPNPYTFLQNQGHDINSVRNGQLKAMTRAYILDSEPNNLYMATYVETNATTPYYTEYLIKYTLTDKEIEEYKWLNSNKYIQACFINDAISAQKSATIISKTRCTVEAHNGLLNSIKTSLKNVCNILLNNKPLGDIYLKCFDVENGTFEVYLFPQTGIMTHAKIATIPLENGSSLVASNTNNAFYKPYIWMEFNTDKDKLATTYPEDATVFNSGILTMPEHNFTLDDNMKR